MLLLLAAHSLLQAEHELREQRMSSNTPPWCVALHASGTSNSNDLLKF